MVEELEYWIGRYQTRIREFGGITLSDVIVQELEIPRRVNAPPTTALP
jgi:hypothetical protein